MEKTALSTSSNVLMVVITQPLSCQVGACVCGIVAWITLALPFGIQSPLQWLYAWSILQVATTGLEFFIILEDGVGCCGFDRPNVHSDVGR